MTLSLYLTCFGIAILGLILSMLLSMRALKIKASLANVVFKPSSYFQDEWISILISLVVIGIFLSLLPWALNWKPDSIKFVRPIFATVGYMGTDIILKFFSAVNSRINSAIDYKTTISDKATGTLDAPTPAAKPQS